MQLFYERTGELTKKIKLKEIQIEPESNKYISYYNEEWKQQQQKPEEADDEEAEETPFFYKYLSNNFLYSRIRLNINSGLVWMFKFALARHTYNTVKYNKFTVNYFRSITRLKLNILEMSKRNFFKKRLPRFIKKRIKTLFSISYFFKNKFYNFFIDIFSLFKQLKSRNKEFCYSLLLNFSSNKVNATVQNLKKKNLINVFAGLFLKFFNNQKNKKKSKIIKMLTARYLRKIFLVSKLYYFNVIVRHNPVDLISFFNILNSPIIAPFKDPYKEKLVEEEDLDKFLIKYNYFVFKNGIPFHKRKIKKKGRIKRKILRKLVIENKIVD